MAWFHQRMAQKAGQAPGTITHVGEKPARPVELRLYRDGDDGLEERVLDRPDVAGRFRDLSGVVWLDVIGLHDESVIEQGGGSFGLHPLVLEDVANTGQRPKVDAFEGYLYAVFKVIFYDAAERTLRTEQFSIVFGERFIVTFRESGNGLLRPVVDRLRNKAGSLRDMGPDYLAFVFLDVVVDQYFVALEQLGEVIEEVEEALVSRPAPDQMQDIHALKKNMLVLRRSVWPLREVVSALERGGSPLVRQETRIYYRDVYDHTIHVIETADTFREIVSGMLDIYLSGQNNRMNEIMKVLTIMATIFIPLTFLTGVYGMNFRFMPELQWHHGYLIVWGLMLAVVGVQLAFFKWKKWI